MRSSGVKGNCLDGFGANFGTGDMARTMGEV